MSSNYVLVSRFPLKNNIYDDFFSSLKSTKSTRYFLCEEQGVNELLELRSFNDIKEISWAEEEMESMFYRFADVLSADIRRELLKFVESPFDNKKDLPETKYIQLRHVEVPAHNYQKYRQWRDETIFNVVRDNKDNLRIIFQYRHWCRSVCQCLDGIRFFNPATLYRSRCSYRAFCFARSRNPNARYVSTNHHGETL